MDDLTRKKSPTPSIEPPSEAEVSRISDLWMQSEHSQSWHLRDQENKRVLAVIMRLSFPLIGVFGYWVESREWQMDSNLHPQGFTFDLLSAKVLGELKVQEYLAKQQAVRIGK